MARMTKSSATVDAGQLLNALEFIEANDLSFTYEANGLSEAYNGSRSTIRLRYGGDHEILAYGGSIGYLIIQIVKDYRWRVLGQR